MKINKKCRIKFFCLNSHLRIHTNYNNLNTLVNEVYSRNIQLRISQIHILIFDKFSIDIFENKASNE